MIEHDEIVNAGIEIVSWIKLEDVVSAFIGSLSTKNLPARSAFGSYVVLSNLENHGYVASERFSGGDCRYCGLRETSKAPISEDAILKYPFQVQHTNLRYSVFDLMTFSSREVDEPTKTDNQILSSIIDSIRSLPESAQLTELNKSIQGKFKSNKHQRTIMLETFGYAGILDSKGQKNFKETFLSYDFVNWEQPSEFHKREWAYPVRFWTGHDGINEENLDYYFGKYL